MWLTDATARALVVLPIAVVLVRATAGGYPEVLLLLSWTLQGKQARRRKCFLEAKLSGWIQWECG